MSGDGSNFRHQQSSVFLMTADEHHGGLTSMRRLGGVLGLRSGRYGKRRGQLDDYKAVTRAMRTASELGRYVDSENGAWSNN